MQIKTLNYKQIYKKILEKKTVRLQGSQTFIKMVRF